MVVEIDTGSSAENKLQPGDVIIGVDNQTVNNVMDFQQISDDLKYRDKMIFFIVSRNDEKVIQVIKP